MDRFDLVVLGAGPGGYVAAIRAAQLGMSVAVVEQERAGGVCLNWGCIPSKSLLSSAELYDRMRNEAPDHGFTIGQLDFDYAKVIARSRRAADRLAKGVESLFKKNDITLISGRGRLAGPDRIQVAAADGTRTVAGRFVLLATGSTERTLPGLEIDGETVLTSRQALECKRVPASLVVIGGGAVGLEFAYVYASFGAAVTVVEMEKQLLPGTDAEVAEELARQFRRRRMKVLTGTRFRSLARTAGAARVEVETAGGAVQALDAEQVLVAVGRRPLGDGIGLEEAGVRVEKGFVQVTPDLRTSVPGVFAIGDLIGPPLIAHKASAEGIVAVQNMKDGGRRSLAYDRIPLCVYCDPEVAVVGLTEERARERGLQVRVGKVPLRAVGKAVAAGHSEGFAKIVSDARHGEILGCHIIGKGATELIAEVALAMTLESTTTEIGDTVHAHPTLSEVIMEAALAAESRSVNF